MPSYSIRAQEVAKEAGNVAEAVRFVTVDGVVVVGE